MDWISIHRLSFLTVIIKRHFIWLSVAFRRSTKWKRVAIVITSTISWYMTTSSIVSSCYELIKIQLGTTSECMSTSIVNFILTRKDEKFLPTIASETKSFQAN